MTIVSDIKISASSERIDIVTNFTNKAKDHRIRTLFPTGIQSEVCHVDSQFDVVARPIKPWEGWKNPSNSNRQQAFVLIENDDAGLLVANRGLPEYEVLRDEDHTIALTLLRSIGELGDWGCFPTPKAQCIGPMQAEYAIIPFAGEENAAQAHRQAYQFSGGALYSSVTARHAGKLKLDESHKPDESFKLDESHKPDESFKPNESHKPDESFKPNESLIRVEGEYINVSALKKAEDRDSLILRVYNTSVSEQKVKIENHPSIRLAFETRLDEERIRELMPENGIFQSVIPAKKIRTFEFVKREGWMDRG